MQAMLTQLQYTIIDEYNQYKKNEYRECLCFRVYDCASDNSYKVSFDGLSLTKKKNVYDE